MTSPQRADRRTGTQLASRPTPWFIEFQDGRPQIRWTSLLIRLGASLTIQIAILLVGWWFFPRKKAWLTIGMVILVFGATFLFQTSRAYRRFFSGSESVRRTQFSLIFLLVLVTTISLLIGFWRWDQQANKKWHADRKAFEAQATEILGMGMAQLSGVENSLMVIVTQKNFSDNDLRKLLGMMTAERPGCQFH